MTFDDLLKRCQTELEKHLLRALYPALSEPEREELVAQFLMEDLTDITLPDFAFPKQKIAIYCDGYMWHKKIKSFIRDRKQLRELQLHSWIVLRFAGREIMNDVDSVVSTIQQALEMVNQTSLEGRVNVHSAVGFIDARNRRIARLNDEFRRQVHTYAIDRHGQLSGKFLVTKRIAALSTEQHLEICAQVYAFNNFTPEIDPDGEHDFGTIDISDVGEIYWKIDYYADEQMKWGSEDPSDPAQTFRVLTIMFADED